MRLHRFHEDWKNFQRIIGKICWFQRSGNWFCYFQELFFQCWRGATKISNGTN